MKKRASEEERACWSERKKMNKEPKRNIKRKMKLKKSTTTTTIPLYGNAFLCTTLIPLHMHRITHNPTELWNIIKCMWVLCLFVCACMCERAIAKVWLYCWSFFLSQFLFVSFVLCMRCVYLYSVYVHVFYSSDFYRIVFRCRCLELTFTPNQWLFVS